MKTQTHTERTNAIAASRARAVAELDDVRRGEFLQALDAADFDVTEFEEQFIESYLRAGPAGWWTERRRGACDAMRRMYGHRI